MKCAIIGYGELGKQLHLFISELHQPDEVIFFDDICYNEGLPNALPFKDFIKEDFKNFSFYLGLGYKNLAVKATVLSQLQAMGRNVPSIIHPSSFISPSAVIGQAVYIYPMCNVDKNVILNDGVILNNSVTVSHDSIIHNNCYISPGVILCGFVHIGSQSFIGAASVVSNNIRIGEKVIVGLATVISNDIQNGVNCIGNPLKILNKSLRIN